MASTKNVDSSLDISTTSFTSNEVENIITPNSPLETPKTTKSTLRLVWRTRSSPEIDNLTKVVDISSPIKTNFTECFKNEITPLSIIPKDIDFDSLDTRFVTRRKKNKRRIFDFHGIDLPSVRSLKQKFENQIETNSEKRSKSLADIDQFDDLDCSPPDLLKQTNLTNLDDMKEFETEISKPKNKLQINKCEETEEINMKISNVETSTLPLVKNLLNIFEQSESIFSESNENVENKNDLDLEDENMVFEESKYDNEDSVSNNVFEYPSIAITSEIDNNVNDDNVMSIKSLRDKWESRIKLNTSSQNLDISKISNKNSPAKFCNTFEKKSPILSNASENNLENDNILSSCVKNIASFYEPKITTVPKSTKTKVNINVEVIVDSECSSPITSIKMNSFPQGESLVELKNNFNKPETKNVCNSLTKENDFDNEGEFKRTRSVKMIKQKFENMTKNAKLLQTLNNSTYDNKTDSEKYWYGKNDNLETSLNDNILPICDEINTTDLTKKYIINKINEVKSCSDVKELTPSIEVTCPEIKINLNDKNVDVKVKTNVTQNIEMPFRCTPNEKVDKEIKTSKEPDDSSRKITENTINNNETIEKHKHSNNIKEKIKQLEILSNGQLTDRKSGLIIDLCASNKHCNNSTNNELPSLNKADCKLSNEASNTNLKDESEKNTNTEELEPSPLRRNGSRKLKPDELKYFKRSDNSEMPKCPIRQRSSSISSSSPSSNIVRPTANFRPRTSMRKCRDLHTDELKFFGLTRSKLTIGKTASPRRASDVSLRLEALQRSFSLDEAGKI